MTKRSRRVSLLLALTLLFLGLCASPAMAASKRPTVGKIKGFYAFFAFGDKSEPNISFTATVNGYNKKGTVYMDVYSGSKRIFRGKETFSRLGSGTFYPGDEYDRRIEISKKGKGLLKAGKKYTLKLYVKTSAGTSKVQTKKFTMPKR